MTKTLTEQWKDMTLAEGDYYIRVVPNLLGKEIIVPCYCSGGYCEGYKDNEVKEVLAPVPSYDEYKELKEDGDYFEKTMFERNADINRLQEQLAEANEVIKQYSNTDNWFTFYDEDYNAWRDSLWWGTDGTKLAKDYLEKWGVK